MSTNKPLQGLKVVDFSDTLTGAQASQLFADFGAEVIHVEKPGGSSIRQLPVDHTVPARPSRNRPVA